MRHDDVDTFEVEGPPELCAEAHHVVAALQQIVTPQRLARIENVVAGRTDAVVPVLDGVHDPHNASAILRSADAFGVQNIYTVEPPEGFRASRGVSKGTHRWLDVHRFDAAEECIDALRSHGYAIHVAMMGATVRPSELRDERVAVVFGNEHRGASKPFVKQADGEFAIAMGGFVESLNVSVAAAVTMHALMEGRAKQMSASRRLELKARFLMNTVRDADNVVSEYLRNQSSG